MNPMKSGSRLEKLLQAGHFVVTAECGPPAGADGDFMRKRAGHLKECVDAANVTDNQTAVVRMSSWAGSLILIQEGIEPIYQMVTRDRNRLAMQSDIMGAHALGIRNMLCLSGDHQYVGDHPNAKNVFDIDSMQLIYMVKKMREEGQCLNGKALQVAPRMFVGAACNPFAEPFDFRVRRLAKKVSAGVDFIQTQCVLNIKRFREFMKQAVDMGLHEKCYILAGISPLKSLGMARYMAKHVPGMDVPEAILKRLEDAGKGKAAEEGIRLTVEHIQQVREIEGVAGVHIMAIEWEERVPEITKKAGLLPRPVI